MTHRHRKVFQTICHDQVHKGLINQADGSWKQASSNQMDLDMQAGYKLAGRLKRAAKKQKAAK